MKILIICMINKVHGGVSTSFCLAGFWSPLLRRLVGLSRKRAVAMTTQPISIISIVLNPPSAGVPVGPGTVTQHACFKYRTPAVTTFPKPLLKNCAIDLCMSAYMVG